MCIQEYVIHFVTAKLCRQAVPMTKIVNAKEKHSACAILVSIKCQLCVIKTSKARISPGQHPALEFTTLPSNRSRGNSRFALHAESYLLRSVRLVCAWSATCDLYLRPVYFVLLNVENCKLNG